MPAAIVRLMYAPEVTEPHWRLHVQPGSAARVGLIGWRTRRPSVDAGVPSEVAALMARALCQVANVSFLDASAREAGDAWEAFPGGVRRLLPAPGPRRAGPRALPLCCTCEPSVAARLFEDDEFQWVLRSQVGLLSAREAAPPALDHGAVVTVLQAQDAALAAWASTWGIAGLAVPGVDGDFVELVAFEPGFEARVHDALAGECDAARVRLEVVGEAAL